MQSNFNPYAPPRIEEQGAMTSPWEGEGPDEAPLATRSARFLAALIDGFILLPIVVGLQFAFGVFANFPHVRALPFEEQVAWGVAGFAFWVAIHGYFLAKRGQTIGKRLLGIQVVNMTDGRQASFVKLVFARNLPTVMLSQIPIIGGIINLVGILMIFGEGRRCLHDHLAGTRVIELPKRLMQG